MEKDTKNPQPAVPNFSRTTDRHDVPDSPVLEAAHRWLLEHSLEHLHGPEEVPYEKDELVVLCLLRNSRTYIESFIEHYFSLGAKHLVFLDNGSTDGTVEALQGYDNVTVLRSQRPYKSYQILFKKYLIERFGQGRWSLYVDADELFDYPYSDVVGLRSFLRYLNDHSYTAVVSYMLDMFPEEPLSEAKDDGSVPLKESHRFCDLSNVLAYSYRDVGDIGNEISNEEIEILQGGVQGTIFGIYPMLIKHPLIFLDDEIKPMDLSDHWTGNARVADITGVLFHYKLSNSLYKAVHREAEEKRYVNRSNKYEKYRIVLESNPCLAIKGETARKLQGVNDLLGTQFLVVSEEYMKFVAAKERKNGHSSESAELERVYKVFAKAQSEARLQARSNGELRRQIRRLQWQKEKSQRQQNRSQQAIGRLQDRLKRLQDQSKSGRRHAETLEGRNRALKARVGNLERQIEDIHASRIWKLMTVLGGIKNRMLKILSR